MRFFCVEEVHGMGDLIELKLVTEDEAECLHRLQVEAFMPLYEKYQDDDTSPAKFVAYLATMLPFIHFTFDFKGD